MVRLVFVLCQPVHSCIEPSLQGLDFFLEIFFTENCAVIQVNPITDTGLDCLLLTTKHDTTLLESFCKMKEGHVLLMCDVSVLSLYKILPQI